MRDFSEYRGDSERRVTFVGFFVMQSLKKSSAPIDFAAQMRYNIDCLELICSNNQPQTGCSAVSSAPAWERVTAS